MKYVAGILWETSKSRPNYCMGPYATSPLSETLNPLPKPYKHTPARPSLRYGEHNPSRRVPSIHEIMHVLNVKKTGTIGECACWIFRRKGITDPKTKKHETSTPKVFLAYAIHDNSGVRNLSVPGIQPHLGAVFEGTAITWAFSSYAFSGPGASSLPGSPRQGS